MFELIIFAAAAAVICYVAMMLLVVCHEAIEKINDVINDRRAARRYANISGTRRN